jgi:hypothetical protein
MVKVMTTTPSKMTRGDGVNGDALDDGTREVDLDDAAQDGHAPDNRVPILGGQEHRVFENSETRAAPCHKVG